MLLKLKILSSELVQFFSLGIESIVSICKVILLSNFSAKTPNPAKKRATILGNGPSLNVSLEQNKNFIQETEIYCVNIFAVSPLFTELKPQNYLLLDPLFFAYDGVKIQHEGCANMFESLRKNTTWKMLLFMPFQAKTAPFIQKVLKENAFIEPVYFNYVIFRGFNFIKHWVFRKNWAMPQCQNVLAATLCMAITRKHQEIYLFGADHSWHEEIRISNDNELLMKSIHFYDNEAKLKHEKLPTFTNKANSKIYLQFQSLSKAFYAYEVLKEYAEHLGVKVWNASAKSYIDTFERCSPSM